MSLTTTHRNGTGKEADTLVTEHRFEEVIAALPPPAKVAEAAETTPAEAVQRNGKGAPCPGRSVLALFCYEHPDSPLGRYVARTVQALARRQVSVHLFARRAFDIDLPSVHDHVVGDGSESGLIDQVEEFAQQAYRAFAEQFPDAEQRVSLLGFEWSAVPALELLRLDRRGDYVLALDSLERQRSDMGSEVSHRIEEIELAGLRQAGTVLVQQPAAGEVAKYWVPECAGRLVNARQPFPVHLFDSRLDPGVVKARFRVGPVDPTVLFIGNMDERHGPDVLMKSVPAVLKNHKQARFVFVGDGPMWWPLRVHARYLLLEHAVRLIGHLEGPPLYELIQAADIVVVPSREPTEWWPIQAAWAARRPVVATHQAAHALVTHEQDGVLVYPHESSLVWGVERLLYDEELLRRVAARGHEKLDERFGWNGVAVQIEELLGVPQVVG